MSVWGTYPCMRRVVIHKGCSVAFRVPQGYHLKVVLEIQMALRPQWPSIQWRLARIGWANLRPGSHELEQLSRWLHARF